jgi:hypothetical protein
MDTLPVIKTTVRDTTYLGRAARVTTIHHDKSKMGLRTVRTTWLDDADERNGGHPAGTTVEHTIKGDGRTANFEVIVPGHVID